MMYSILADAVVVLHFLFIVFAVSGGCLVLFSRKVVWLHLPCALWAVLVEAFGWICPLTPLEVELGYRAGRQGYEGSFVEHYLIPLIYPSWLTREIQWLLGAGVVMANLSVYGFVLWRYKRVRKGT